MKELKIKALQKEREKRGHIDSELYYLEPDDVLREQYQISEEVLDYIFHKGQIWRYWIGGYYCFNRLEFKRAMENKSLLKRAYEHEKHIQNQRTNKKLIKTK